MPRAKCQICNSEENLLGPIKFKQNQYFCYKCIFGISDKDDIRLPVFKKGEQYQLLLEIAEAEEVPWNDVTEFVRDLLFPHWPVDNGRKVGYQRAFKEFEEHKKAGQFLNRFISWKSTNFINYNHPKR